VGLDLGHLGRPDLAQPRHPVGPGPGGQGVEGGVLAPVEGDDQLAGADPVDAVVVGEALQLLPPGA
jgi:hypothetical protein